VLAGIKLDAIDSDLAAKTLKAVRNGIAEVTFPGAGIQNTAVFLVSGHRPKALREGTGSGIELQRIPHSTLHAIPAQDVFFMVESRATAAK